MNYIIIIIIIIIIITSVQVLWSDFTKGMKPQRCITEAYLFLIA